VTTIDRHIIRRLLLNFFWLIGSLIVFFIVLHYVEYIDDFFDRGARLSEVFLVYYPNYIPEIVKLTSPLAIFISSVYLTAKLSHSMQLVALQTSGVSLYRILRPYVLVGIIISCSVFWFNGWVVPKTNKVVLEFEKRYLKDNQQEIDLNDIHRQNQPGNIVTVGYFDRDSQIAHRVSIQSFDSDHQLVSRIDATRMSWIDSLSVWRIYNGVERLLTGTGWIERRNIAQRDTILHILPRDLARTERDVESMTIPEATAFIDELRRSGAGQIGRSLVGYHVKFAYPIANFIMVLIALPLAAVRRKGGKAIQIGLGLLVAFIYLAVQKLTEPFGYTGELSPMLTAWLPHILFICVGYILLVTARK